MQTLLLFLPAVIGVLTGLATITFLYASQLILADDGDYHLGGIGYHFDTQTLRQAFLSGGLMGIGFLYLIPYFAFNSAVFHWIPILIIALLTTQAFIDLSYYELADEWNMALGVLSLTWIQLTVGVTFAHFWLVIGLFVLFYFSWFFTDFPGYGDVKMVLAGGVLLSGFIGAYQFILFSTTLAVLMTLVSCHIDKVPKKEWLKQRFAFGPYLALILALALVNVI